MIVDRFDNPLTTVEQTEDIIILVEADGAVTIVILVNNTVMRDVLHAF